MSALARVLRELAANRVMYAVDRWTGQIRPLSVEQYIESEAAGLLEGYVVRLGVTQAQATAAAIRLSSIGIATEQNPNSRGRILSIAAN